MPRRLLALLVLAFASCAKSAGSPPASSGGGGDTLTVTTTLGSGGAGGANLFDAGPPVDAGACSPFAETFMPACLACLAASCCDVAQMCAAVPDCFAYTNCVQNCPPVEMEGGTNACLDACAMNAPMAQPAYGSMTSCLQTNCSGTCPF